jgi:curved DNA-binding protein CbpA
MQNGKDYYSVLGVNKEASENEIKSAYRKLAKKWHPDVNSDPNATKVFQGIKDAFEVLGNPERKARYDSVNYSEPENQFTDSKSVKRSRRSDKLDQFFESIIGIDSRLEYPLIRLFEKVEDLDLVLRWGSGSRSIKTPFKMSFPQEENRGGFNRAFNFGNIKSDGTFFNSSCERDVGRNYLTHLSSLIPQTTTRFMENEFKNTIIQNNGKPVPLSWMLDRQDEWIELIKKLLPYLHSQKVI